MVFARQKGSCEVWRDYGRKVNVVGAGGRPTLYMVEYNNQAYKLCLLGATDKELADFFEVEEQTINNWKEDYPEFFESLKRGKITADAEVAEKLLHRAKGYSHKEDKIFLHEGEPVIVPTIKHYAPDTLAAMYWLNNRNPNRWKQKQEVELSGEIGIKSVEQLLDDL
jgi:hypothetical protein